jgi:hypothetical protein
VKPRKDMGQNLNDQHTYEEYNEERIETRDDKVKVVRLRDKKREHHEQQTKK